MQGLDHWSGKMSHVTGQLRPCSATREAPTGREAHVPQLERALAHSNWRVAREQQLERALTATRESPRSHQLDRAHEQQLEKDREQQRRPSAAQGGKKKPSQTN